MTLAFCSRTTLRGFLAFLCSGWIIQWRILLTVKNPNFGCLSHIKVARPSIFIATPSTFESLILKQIDLYSMKTRE